MPSRCSGAKRQLKPLNHLSEEQVYIIFRMVFPYAERALEVSRVHSSPGQTPRLDKHQNDWCQYKCGKSIVNLSTVLVAS